MTSTRLSGAYTALVTPFRKGTVDVPALEALVEAQIQGGIDGLVPCGTTGESVTLTHEEHRLVVRTVIATARKRVPVFAGAGTVSTRHTIELAELAKNEGADGILLVMPYYNRPTQGGLVAHVREVLKHVSIPTMLYNIPGRTGVDLSLDSLGELAGVADIVAVKEATGNVLRSQAICARFGDRFAVFSGDDALTLPILSVGGVGVVSVTSNALPAAVRDVVATFARGEVADARRKHLRLVGVHDAMFIESNPGPVKSVLAARGAMAPEIRLPLVWPSESTVKAVWAAVDAHAKASA